jgi:hypothetical protein
LFQSESTSALPINTNSIDNLNLLTRTLFLQQVNVLPGNLLTCTLFLRQLNILPNQVHNYVLERLRLDSGPELETCKGTVVGQQTLLDGLREVLCRVDFGVFPLEQKVLVNDFLLIM